MNRGFQRGCARELGVVPTRPASVQGPIPRTESIAYDAGVMVVRSNAARSVDAP